jgi:hypothetical protein
MNARTAFANALIASRVTARFVAKQGMEFPTERALSQYLKDHPKADKSMHSVKKKGKPPSKENQSLTDKDLGRLSVIVDGQARKDRPAIDKVLTKAEKNESISDDEIDSAIAAVKKLPSESAFYRESDVEKSVASLTKLKGKGKTA